MKFYKAFKMIVPLLVEAQKKHGKDKAFVKMMRTAHKDGGDEGLLGFLAGVLGKLLPKI